jgi:hypothetical protein
VNEHEPSQVVRRECDITVDHLSNLYKRALRVVESVLALFSEPVSSMNNGREF